MTWLSATKHYLVVSCPRENEYSTPSYVKTLQIDLTSIVVSMLAVPTTARLLQAREEAKAKMGLSEVDRRALTVPQPFKLTKPNPRRVPEPMKIEQVSSGE